MISKVNSIQKSIFIFLTIGIILFFIWSKLILISFALTVIVDSFTTQFLSRFIKKHISKSAFSILKYSYYILLPIAFAIVTRTFLFDIYYVPSSSMERTLFPDDYVLINKFSYGVKVPKRTLDIPVIGGLFKNDYNTHQYDLYRSLKSFKNYNRDDIVVFKSINKVMFLNNVEYLISHILFQYSCIG